MSHLFGLAFFMQVQMMAGYGEQKTVEKTGLKSGMGQFLRNLSHGSQLQNMILALFT